MFLICAPFGAFLPIISVCQRLERTAPRLTAEAIRPIAKSSSPTRLEACISETQELREQARELPTIIMRFGSVSMLAALARTSAGASEPSGSSR
jgi:hypothetical protein